MCAVLLIEGKLMKIDPVFFFDIKREWVCSSHFFPLSHRSFGRDGIFLGLLLSFNWMFRHYGVSVSQPQKFLKNGKAKNPEERVKT